MFLDCLSVLHEKKKKKLKRKTNILIKKYIYTSIFSNTFEKLNENFKFLFNKAKLVKI